MNRTVLVATLLMTAVIAVVDIELPLRTRSWFLGWLVPPVLGVVTLVAGRLSRRKPLRSAGLVMLLAGVIGGVIGRQVTIAKIDSSKATGDAIISALEQHRTSAGTYPQSLEELVPAHFEQIPRPDVGLFTETRYLYTPMNDLSSFGLVFAPTKGTVMVRTEGEDWKAMPFAH